MYIYIYIYMYIYKGIYIYTYIYICVCMYASLPSATTRGLPHRQYPFNPCLDLRHLRRHHLSDGVISPLPPHSPATPEPQTLTAQTLNTPDKRSVVGVQGVKRSAVGVQGLPESPSSWPCIYTDICGLVTTQTLHPRI